MNLFPWGHSPYSQDIDQIAQMLDVGKTFDNPEVAEKIQLAAENHKKSEEEIRGAAHHKWGKKVTSREATERRLNSMWLRRIFTKKNPDKSFKYRKRGENFGDFRKRYFAGEVAIDEEDK